MLPRVETGPGRLARAATWTRRHPTVAAGGVILTAIALLGFAAPLITPVDPLALNPVESLLPPGANHWFGTDHLGRVVFTRVIYGTRVSLIVAVSVALAATVIGLFLGLVAGYLRRVDAVVRLPLGKAQGVAAVDVERRVAFPQVDLAGVHLGQMSDELGDDVTLPADERLDAGHEAGIGNMGERLEDSVFHTHLYAMEMTQEVHGAE